jgi:hypothetical protein
MLVSAVGSKSTVYEAKAIMDTGCPSTVALGGIKGTLKARLAFVSAMDEGERDRIDAPVARPRIYIHILRNPPICLCSQQHPNPGCEHWYMESDPSMSLTHSYLDADPDVPDLVVGSQLVCGRWGVSFLVRWNGSYMLLDVDESP